MSSVREALRVTSMEVVVCTTLKWSTPTLPPWMRLHEFGLLLQEKKQGQAALACRSGNPEAATQSQTKSGGDSSSCQQGPSTPPKKVARAQPSSSSDSQHGATSMQADVTKYCACCYDTSKPCSCSHVMCSSSQLWLAMLTPYAT